RPCSIMAPSKCGARRRHFRRTTKEFGRVSRNTDLLTNPPKDTGEEIMSDKKIVEIAIEDIEEIVGGLNVAAVDLQPVKSTIVIGSRGLVAYDPDTCPTTPGGPVSTCMCPGSAEIGGIIKERVVGP